MKKFSILIICFLFIFSAHATRLSGANSPQQRDELIRYHDSGKYIKEIESKLEEGWRYLEHRLSSNTDERLAIVLDIDETAISNYADLKRLYFTGNSEAVAAAYMLGDGQVIEPIHRLYEYALKQNVAVFFITGRPATPEITNVTASNLRKAGYDTWEKLYLRPVNNDKMTIQQFKTLARKEISDAGYSIVLNIGDQNIDLKGGFSEANIKVPNPFYSAA